MDIIMTDNKSFCHIDLNSVWELGYCDSGSSNFENQPEYTLACPVPGDVHIPFIENGMIKEPLKDLNGFDCRWLEEKEFWYRTHFTVSEENKSARKLLTFEGLDCDADIYLNGKHIGSHNNSFVEIIFDVTETAVTGENELVVRIDSGCHSVRNKPLEDMSRMWNSEQPYRAWMRKPQFVYGWDWTIWLETCGIWKSVYLDCYESAHIADVYVHPENTDVPVAGETAKAVAEIEIADIAEPASVTVSVYNSDIYDDGVLIYTETVPAKQNMQLSLTIPNAKLWWCNEVGEPYQYRVEVKLVSSDGKILDTQTRSYGIRSISIREEELSEEESGFTFILNGQPIFCKGANHVPADCIIGRITDEKSQKLVEMAADSHMNMLRVWGGGIYESEAFLKSCDGLGIMVWHDFMYACGYYPDHDLEYLENVTTEAIKAVKRLRNHTSVIGWSGNNEIQEMYYGMIQYTKLARPYGMKLFNEILPEVVKNYHFGAVYRPTSPSGGKNPADIERGDQHIWHFTHRPGFEHYQDLAHFTDFNVKFLSEFGLVGAMNYESSLKSVSDMNRESKCWLYHCNESQGRKVLDNIIKVHFDNVDHMDTQEYILKSQAIQSDITHYIYDEFRRRKFVCSGLLFWTLSDSYGIHNWSIIDYYLDKRPLYYVLKRATSPISVSVKGFYPNSFKGQKDYRSYYTGSPEPVEIWVCNDTLADKNITAEYSLMTFGGDMIENGSIAVEAPANKSVAAASVDIAGKITDPEATVFAVKLLENGRIIASTEFLFAPFKMLKTEKAKISCEKEVMYDNRVKLRLKADKFVWSAHIAGTDKVKPSDNDFNMLPGEVYEIEVKTENASDYVPNILSPGTYPEIS